MRVMKKLLSVAVSLSLCASLTAPAFAASFDDLQDAIDGNKETGTLITDSGREEHYGYDRDEETGSYGVESWKNDEGGRDVQLKEEVKHEDTDKSNSITVTDDVTIDLKGNDIVGSGKDSVIKVSGEDASLTVKDTSEGDETGKITGGSTTGDGGGVSVNNGASFTLESGEISGNHANMFGGGVGVNNGGSFTMTGGTISGNDALNGGGVSVVIGTVTVDGKDALIDDNTAKNGGGGVFLNGVAAGLQGGGEGSSKFVMEDGTISNNKTGGEGGGVSGYNTKEQPQKAEVVINGGAISGNESTGNGGGIAINHGNLTVGDADITGNTTANYGGGIYSASSNTVLNGTKISGNKATNGNFAYGGGAFASGSTLTVTDVDVFENEATYGGGIFAGGTNTTVVMSDSEIYKNTAAQGAGMYVNAGAQATVDNSIIRENTASMFAGGVRVAMSSTFNMSNGKLYGNTATNFGDDVYSSNSTIVLFPADSMEENITVGEKTRPISGWYWDGNPRWGDGEGHGYIPRVINSNGDTRTLCLKAAHDEYFNVVYTDGVEDEEIFTDQTWEVENKTILPGFTGGNPVRPGYTFAGWVADADINLTDGTVTGPITMIAQWTPLPVVEPEVPEIPDAGDDADAGDDTTAIEEGAVPLASGPVTRAEFVDYLWRHEGQPAPAADSGLFEDVTEEHEYSPAVAWAKSIGIISGYEDGTFLPDELVTVSAARGILTRYAAYLGIQMPALTALVGEDEEPVLNCDEVISEFFGE